MKAGYQLGLVTMFRIGKLKMHQLDNQNSKRVWLVIETIAQTVKLAKTKKKNSSNSLACNGLLGCCSRVPSTRLHSTIGELGILLAW